MKSKTITVNDIEITVHSDGSITKPFRSRTKRTFGGRHSYGYMRVKIGSKVIRLHRLIAQAFLPDFFDFPQVDHIDGNKANNDISNLRMATSASNHQAYKTKSKGCTSQYRGVSWNKRDKKWYASCMINFNPKHIGCFDNEHDAAIARDAYVFSQGVPREGLNFPENYA